MKKFDLQKIDNQTYGYIIFSVNYYSPIDYLSSIERRLDKIKYEGKVLFDLLLVNGNGSNRYLTAEYRKGAFDKKSFSVKNQVPETIRKTSTNYYAKRPDILRNSVLTRPVVYSMLNSGSK